MQAVSFFPRYINMQKVEASANDNQAGSISVTLDINDIKHLQRVIKVVRSVPGVMDVARVQL